jgi:hypothetical protein
LRYVYVCFTWDDPRDGLSFEIHRAFDTLAAADDWALAAAQSKVDTDEWDHLGKHTWHHDISDSVVTTYQGVDGTDLAGYYQMEVDS